MIDATSFYQLYRDEEIWIELMVTPPPPARAPVPHWSTYVDLTAKICLPLAVLGATLMWNAADARNARIAANRKDCVNHQFDYAKLSSDADAVAAEDLWEALVEECKSAGKKLNNRTLLHNAAYTTANVDTFGDAARKLGRNLPQSLPANAKTAPQPVVDRSTAELFPRVYVQIQDEDQRAEADKLRAILNSSQISGKRILVPNVELPKNPRARVAKTELRCAKSDCANAPELAAYIAARLGRTTISVRDISALYGNQASRPGHYELWFGPESFSVKAVPASG